jgi:hypothetical protein
MNARSPTQVLGIDVGAATIASCLVWLSWNGNPLVQTSVAILALIGLMAAKRWNQPPSDLGVTISFWRALLLYLIPAEIYWCSFVFIIENVAPFNPAGQFAFRVAAFVGIFMLMSQFTKVEYRRFLKPK